MGLRVIAHAEITGLVYSVLVKKFQSKKTVMDKMK